MSSYPYTYSTVTNITEDGMQSFFISEGEFDIIKAVRYAFAFDFKGKPVYNLAFGNYDFRTDTLFDDQTSNNGDAYQVFHTVLDTIPDFFLAYPNAMMMVQGSECPIDELPSTRIMSTKTWSSYPWTTNSMVVI
jgi:hypothetical protein